MEKVALSIGGNIGDVKGNFRVAIEKLKTAGLKCVKHSSCYSTTPVDCSNKAPDFVNSAITGEWSKSSEELLSLCKKIEREAGRPEIYKRNSDRPVDLDIIFFGSETKNTESLIIPHKEMANRLFVLIPLAEIAKDWIHPVLDKTVVNIMSDIDNTDEFEKIMNGKSKL